MDGGRTHQHRPHRVALANRLLRYTMGSTLFYPNDRQTYCITAVLTAVLERDGAGHGSFWNACYGVVAVGRHTAAQRSASSHAQKLLFTLSSQSRRFARPAALIVDNTWPCVV